MVKWLILILAGYALYRLFANDLNKKQKESKQESAAEMERKVAAGEMVKDPECGAYVAVDGSISVRDGETQYMYDRHAQRKKREKSEIGIHSVRGGTIVGEHEVIFAGNNEVITLSHSAQSKELFAVGAVNAAVFMSGKGPGLYDMSALV